MINFNVLDFINTNSRIKQSLFLQVRVLAALTVAKGGSKGASRSQCCKRNKNESL